MVAIPVYVVLLSLFSRYDNRYTSVGVGIVSEDKLFCSDTDHPVFVFIVCDIYFSYFLVFLLGLSS